jgi:hypothetical protein
MSTLCSSSLTSGFIDLATYDEQEKYLYGGQDSTAYFVRETKKATWFTQVPVVLSRASGSPAFGQDWSVTISRSGDYLLHTWIRLVLPSITLAVGNQFGADGTIRWTRNLMHNIVKESCITFNDLVAARMDNYHLDFWAAFTVPEGKRAGYSQMIGNVDVLTTPHVVGDTIPSQVLNLPLPFFFCRDSGVALPTAALPYNDMRICFAFRNWNELLVVESLADTKLHATPTLADVGGQEPVLANTQVWGNYSIVANDERKRMACAPRDILIEQVQTSPIQTFTPATNPQQQYDIRFAHSVKALFFGVRNKTTISDWSNYTTSSPVVTAGPSIEYTPVGAVDPILQTSLIYENTNRISQMGSDYFSLVQPWFFAPVIPVETGYHMYSYSLDFYNLDPKGSTNFGKLTNVTVVPEASQGAVVAANGTGAVDQGADFAQKFCFIITAINNNVIRISGGALGFPVL